MLEVLTDVVELSRKKCTSPIRGDLKYATADNFLGRSAVGYHTDAVDVCLLAKEASLALCEVQNCLVKNNRLGLIVYDAYRPLRAVKDFLNWINQPPVGAFELEKKQIHYPLLEKKNLANLGFLAKKVSRHCFGSAVDVGLISLEDGREINMGTCFDYFGNESHILTPSSQIGEEAVKNRKTLVSAMQEFDFLAYEKEYWHFDYKQREIDEPMDFEITSKLRGIVAQERQFAPA
jgi:zinc D-Ala-D-Ala dipeptidase